VRGQIFQRVGEKMSKRTDPNFLAATHEVSFGYGLCPLKNNQVASLFNA
jgi:hypothetical protein